MYITPFACRNGLLLTGWIGRRDSKRATRLSSIETLQKTQPSKDDTTKETNLRRILPKPSKTPTPPPNLAHTARNKYSAPVHDMPLYAAPVRDMPLYIPPYTTYTATLPALSLRPTLKEEQTPIQILQKDTAVGTLKTAAVETAGEKTAVGHSYPVDKTTADKTLKENVADRTVEKKAAHSQQPAALHSQFHKPTLETVEKTMDINLPSTSALEQHARVQSQFHKPAVETIAKEGAIQNIEKEVEKEGAIDKVRKTKNEWIKRYENQNTVANQHTVAHSHQQSVAKKPTVKTLETKTDIENKPAVKTIKKQAAVAHSHSRPVVKKRKRANDDQYYYETRAKNIKGYESDKDDSDDELVMDIDDDDMGEPLYNKTKTQRPTQ